MRRLSIVLCLFAAITAHAGAGPRAEINMLATPTTYELARGIALAFAADKRFPAPRVEAASDALARFCSGLGLGSADFALADRALSAAEERACRAAGATPVEVVLGWSGLAVLKSRGAPAMALTRRDLFLAIAKDVPSGDGRQLKMNAFATWDAIDPKLPKTPIEVIGPPDGSPGALALGEFLVGGARTFPALAGLEARDPQALLSFASATRGVPAYRPGAADQDPHAALAASPAALVLASLTWAEAGGLAAVAIEGRLPTGPNVVQGNYPLAREVRLFLKREHVGIVPGLSELLDEALGASALGGRGYLRPLGLVPAPRGRFGVTAGAILARTR